ncbi:hypothetical protein [Roseateles sp. BYS96W]|uniref:Uncharacterized protein n=1 Tax=Pelomonas nitida TaxID=3299027 RepID=A0ABW7GA82_9BURK
MNATSTPTAKRLAEFVHLDGATVITVDVWDTLGDRTTACPEREECLLTDLQDFIVKRLDELLRERWLRAQGWTVFAGPPPWQQWDNYQRGRFNKVTGQYDGGDGCIAGYY